MRGVHPVNSEEIDSDVTAFESFLCKRDPRAVYAAGTGSLTLMYDAAAHEQGFPCAVKEPAVALSLIGVAC